MTAVDSRGSFAEELVRALAERGAECGAPLSVEQRRLWLLSGMASGQWATVVGRYRVHQPPDPARIQLRLASLLAQHEALRSVFVQLAGRPVRLVMPLADVALRVVDTAEATADDHVRHLAAERFSFEHGPLLRALLLRSPVGLELVLAGHRLVLDESSLDVLASGLLADQDPEPVASPELSAVLSEERDRLRDADSNDKVADWCRVLAQPAASDVPSSRMRPVLKQHVNATVIVSQPVIRAHRVGDGEWRAAVVTAWLTLLMRHQATSAAVCGVRLPRERRYRHVVGPLDTLRPVRLEASENEPLGRLVEAVAEQLGRSALEVPFAYLLEVQPPRRDLSRTPYLQTVVRAVDARRPLVGTAMSDPAAGQRVPSGLASTEHDLELTAWLVPTGIELQIDYDTHLYGEADVRALAEQLSAILDAILPGGPSAHPTTVPTVSLLTASGAQRAIAAGRGPRVEIGQRSLVDLVTAQVANSPQAVALRHGAVEMTYAQLWRRAQRLAAELASRGVRPGDRVAVWLRRGPDAIAALLGVLTAGAVYVPFDPAHPEGRVRYLLDDSDPSLVLTESSVDVLGELPARVLRIDALHDVRDGVELPTVPADAPAYLIYTSGSTGRPKAVLVRHHSVVNNVLWRQHFWSLDKTDRLLHNHAFSFDPAIWAVFWPLSTGASIALASEREMHDPAALVGMMRKHRVTVVGGVPSLLSVVLDHPDVAKCTSVRLVLSGAEPLTAAVLDRVAATWKAKVVNLYGPTEATIDATGYPVPPANEPPLPVPIGNGMHNADVHVVDIDLWPLPDRVPGEIVIGGAGLALGYHRRRRLTAERFLPDPLGTEPGGRLYRTGDLGRRLPDGAIQFLGRIDDQVKIRGHRVELPEIEAALAAQPGLQEVAVVALNAGTEQARLAAAIVTTQEAEPTTDSVRAVLSSELPDYLVPDRIIALDALPRSPNGKIDRKSLAEQLAGSAPKQGVRTAPRTELESAVALAFAQVLRVDAVEAHADFFGLGGTSMMLARLASLLGSRHAVEIPLHEFFRTPTVAGVAETIEVYRREGIAGVLARQHAATLERDGTLDESIRVDGLPAANWAQPQRALLTGATGYLGLHLLEQLLRRTSAQVVCLCRGNDEQHALQRIKDGLDQYEIDIDDQLDRVRCVVGDLAAPRLGLTADQWEELAATIDVIYHNGAMVNFVYPYSALKATNVGGTQRVLELACATVLKAVHHISTIDTLLATHSPRPFLEDSSPLRSAVGVPAGYTGSKWVAEKVVDEARRRGIPVTVFRPGLILGHTRTGATQTIDYLLVALRGFLPMRILPDYPRIFDVIPVDYVASAVVHISRQKKALGGFFHLFNPAPVALRTFCDWIADYGYEFDIVPFEEGRRRALQVGPGDPLYPLVPLIRDAEAEPHRALDPRFMHEVEPDRECEHTLRFLAGSDIVCPPSTEAAAHDVLDYLVRVGFMPAPADVVLDEDQQ